MKKFTFDKNILSELVGFEIPDKQPRKTKKKMKKLIVKRVEESLKVLMDQMDRKEIKLEEMFNEDKNQQIKEFIDEKIKK